MDTPSHYFGFEKHSLPKVVLERVNLYVQSVLTEYPGLQQSANLAAHLDPNVRNMVLTLKSWCVSWRVPSNEVTEIVEWPDGPWQAFKEKYAPEWWKAKFPVRMHRHSYKTVTNHYFVCPHLVMDERDRHLQFMVIGTRQASQMHPR